MQNSKLSSKSQVTLPKEVRAALNARPGGVTTYEVEGNVVYFKRPEPFDAAFHKALSNTRSEWGSAADNEAFSAL